MYSRSPAPVSESFHAEEAQKAALRLPICVFELISAAADSQMPQRICRAREALRQVEYYLQIIAPAEGARRDEETRTLVDSIRRALRRWPVQCRPLRCSA